VRRTGKPKQRRLNSLHRRIEKAQIRDAIRVRAKALARALAEAEASNTPQPGEHA
jgi:hypothetical protein